MSSLIDLHMECWIVDDTLLSDNDSIVSLVYMVLRLETTRMPYMSTLFFDTRLIGLDISYLVLPVIESGSQPHESY